MNLGQKTSLAQSSEERKIGPAQHCNVGRHLPSTGGLPLTALKTRCMNVYGKRMHLMSEINLTSVSLREGSVAQIYLLDCACVTENQNLQMKRKVSCKLYCRTCLSACCTFLTPVLPSEELTWPRVCSTGTADRMTARRAVTNPSTDVAAFR